MLHIITTFLDAYSQYLTPLYFFSAWTFFGLLLSTLIVSFRDIRKRGKIMHQIPCTNCKYFTNNYRLKCTIRPFIANTESAIDCPDFMIKENW